MTDIRTQQPNELNKAFVNFLVAMEHSDPQVT